jgi:hypothetical protein
MTNIFRVWVPPFLLSTVICLFVARSESAVYHTLRRDSVENARDETGILGSERKLQSTVVQFRLINADTEKVITDLMQNAVVDIGTVPASSLTVEAIAAPGSTHQSAKITLTGAQNYTNVEHGMITLCGNTGSNYANCDFLTVGKYNLKVDLFSKTGGSGQIVGSGMINFELKQGTPPIRKPTSAPVVSGNNVVYTLVNAETDIPLTTLTQNSVIDIGNIPANKLNILVTGTGISSKSGKISLTGAQSITEVENGVLALCGNNGANFFMCKNLVLGKYTISAELYSMLNAGGKLLAKSSIDFQLTSTVTTAAPMKKPTTAPNGLPTNAPTLSPTVAPDSLPTIAPHRLPTAAPKSMPTVAPNRLPTTAPNKFPTVAPRQLPTLAPNRQPTTAPHRLPTLAPMRLPTLAPNRLPTLAPNRLPTAAPAKLPTVAPVILRTNAPKMSPVATTSCSIPKVRMCCRTKNFKVQMIHF